MSTTQTPDLERALSVLGRAVPSLVAVYLFGSSSSGHATPSSDIDLAVLAREAVDPLVRFHGAQDVAQAVGRDVDLIVEAESPWIGSRPAGDGITVPAKHGDGAWYHPQEGLGELEANGQILLRYAEDVNGATDRVACVTNAAGNVCGLMPHPEHAVDPLLGSIDGQLLVGRLCAA